MNEPAKNHTRILLVFLTVVSVAALTFLLLWLREKDRPPTTKEVVKEVPREVIKEVPREVIKQVEVPAKLTLEQQLLIDNAMRFWTAPWLTNRDDVFGGVGSVNLQLGIDDAIKKVLSEEQIRNRVELILRQSRIRMDADATASLLMAWEGFWNEDDTILTFTTSISLHESVFLTRGTNVWRHFASTWRSNGYARVGRMKAQEALLRNVSEYVEEFANKFLAAHERVEGQKR